MGRRTSKLRTMAALIRAGHYDEVRKRFQRWIYSDSFSYGLCRDLTVPFEAPPAKVQLAVRPMMDAEARRLLDTRVAGLSGLGIYERLNRLEFVEAHIPTCFVAVTENDEPCYMQALVGPSENATLQKYFAGYFPLLRDDEALLEHAFTRETFQGLGIMPHAMARIAEKGLDLGARWIITFVAHDNIPALKGCKRAGFSPYLIRRESWRLFRKQLSFEELPQGTPHPFDRDRVAVA